MAAAAGTVPFHVASDRVKYTETHILSEYEYTATRVTKGDGGMRVTPVTHHYSFKTDRRVPKLGVMVVGWGGNNGTTITAGVLANKHNLCYRTKEGLQKPDYYGSVMMSSTVKLGVTDDGEEIFVPMRDLIPTVHPNDIVFGGWDISSLNLADAMHRAQVLPWELQTQLEPYMRELKPLPSIYIPDFIASNQEDRADNVLKGSKWEMMEQIRKDIREFKARTGVDKVVVLWSANTERFSEIVPGKNDTADHLLQAIREDFSEVSPSTLFAVAAILEGVPYINGSPQNTFVPGVIELAERHKSPIGGDDFKTGQTKFKSVLVDFLISSGIKPMSIVSYNHLGNNDGKNLSAPQQFRAKEISKSNVVDDMVASNPVLYAPGEHPDHTVVIKYVPYVGDSKRAMDEYISKVKPGRDPEGLYGLTAGGLRIFLGGTNTIVVHNTCEDSLLAAPVMLDLVLLMELSTRIEYKTAITPEYEHFHPVMSLLSFLLKAPQVPPGTPVVNALFKQRACIENVLRALLGLAPEHNMGLEYKTRVEGVTWHTPAAAAVAAPAAAAPASRTC